MAQKIAKQIFIGMDTDTTDRLIEQGSYRGALNVHVGTSEGSDSLSVETVKGNTLVSYSLPIGINKIIGSHEDIINKCVYYFLYNSSTVNIQSTSGSTVTTSSAHGLVLSDLVDVSGISGRTNILGKWIVKPTGSNTFDILNPLTYVTPSLDTIVLTGTSGASGTITKYQHSILKYDSVANSISLIYQHSRFNFDQNYPITGTALVNNVLHWADALNPPRSLYLTEAILYGTFFVEPMIDFIRIPPTKELSVVGRWVNPSGVDVPYTTNSGFINNMNDKSYQFIYRYIYKDDSRSVWSPISATIATGYIDSKVNRIDITISNEETTNFLYYSKVIKNIELAFRDSVTFNFKYIDRILFPIATTSVSYSFFNDVAYSVIDSTETAKFFDSVPKIAGSLASVQNRIFQGDSLEGFDVDATDFSISSIDGGGNLIKNIIKWKKGDPYDIGIVFFDRASRKTGVTRLGRLTIPSFVAPSFVINGTPPIWATHYMIVRTATLRKSFFIQGFAMINKANSQTFEILFNNVNGDLSYVAQDGDYCIFLITNNYTSTTDLYKYKILSNSADDFGNSVIVLENGTGINTVNVDKRNEFGPPGTFFLVEIYSPSKNEDQLYYETPFKFPIKDPGTPQRTFSGTDIFGTLKLYNYVSGDVYRRNLNDSMVYHSRTTISVQALNFIPNTALSITINGDTYAAGAYTTTNGMTETIMANALVDQINGANKPYKAIMFYTGKEQSVQSRDTIARFIVYSTIKGSAANITINASTFNITFGFKNGIFELTNTNVSGAIAQSFIDSQGIVESMVCNDTLPGWDSNIGRSNIVLRNGDREVRRKTLVRFGGTFVSGTQINNANSFESTDSKDLTNNGAVKKLIAASNNSAEGTILLAAQENEISSLYIGQTMIKNAGGGENLAVTDDVIGTVNPLQKLVGTINPESVVQHNGIVYGFDALRGIVWRYGQDGLNFLSDVGMKNFFYTRSAYLLSLGSFKCFAGIDPFHEEYVLSVPNADSSQTTVAWSEKTNRWTSFRSFIPEWMQKINTKFLTFLNGQLWVHNSSTYNNFYGTQYTSKMRLICNQEPDNVKILQMIEEVAQGGHWNSPEINTPEGQSSELIGLFDISNPSSLPADFRNYEGKYVGMVMRDKNTPNMIPTDYPLLRGDVIRSQVFDIILERSGTTKANLFMVNLGYIDSYKITR